MAETEKKCPSEFKTLAGIGFQSFFDKAYNNAQAGYGGHKSTWESAGLDETGLDIPRFVYNACFAYAKQIADTKSKTAVGAAV